MINSRRGRIATGLCKHALAGCGSEGGKGPLTEAQAAGKLGAESQSEHNLGVKCV